MITKLELLSSKEYWIAFFEMCEHNELDKSDMATMITNSIKEILNTQK